MIDFSHLQAGGPSDPTVDLPAPFKKPNDGRARGLVLVRESDEFNRSMFDGMREQTYNQFRDIPEIALVASLGLAPLDARNGYVTLVEDTPDGKVEHAIQVHKKRKGRTTIYYFAFRGYWHLWSMASAAATGDSGTNDFTDLASDVIEDKRPLTLCVANISRLIRSMKHALDLERALVDNVDELWLGSGGKLALTGPSAEIGFMMLRVIGMMAAMERSWIEQRTVTGKIFRASKKWPLGVGVVPFGYLLDEDLNLVPDPRKVEQVAAMLTILSSDAPPQEMLLRMDEIGVKSTRRRRMKKKATTGSDRNASDRMARLYTWASLYVSGEYVFRLRNTLQYVDQIGGVPVVRYPDDPEDDGEFQILIKPGVPEGGWAHSDVLNAFAAKAIQRFDARTAVNRRAVRPLNADITEQSELPILHNVRMTGSVDLRDRDGLRVMADPEGFRERQSAARSKRIVATLSGRRWSDDDFEYELVPETVGSYRLVRWARDAIRGRVGQRRLNPERFPRSSAKDV